MHQRVRALLAVLLTLTITLAIGLNEESFQAQEASTFFYVAPNGNDENPGTIDAPFQTIQKARDVVRSVTGNVTVYLRAGTYQPATPITLTSSDSGKSGTVTYQAYQQETVVVRGSRTITNFTATGNGVYSASLPSNEVGQVGVEAVYIDGSRLEPARFPNYIQPSFNATDPWAGNFSFVANQAASKNSITYSSGLDPSSWTNPTTGRVNIFTATNYTNEIVNIASVDLANRRINLATNTYYDIVPGNRFFVSHIKEELDAPGEWFYSSAEQKLNIIPPAGVDMATARVTVPVLRTIFQLQDVHQVALANIRVEETNEAGIVIDSGSQITLADLTIQNVLSDGVRLNGAISDIVIDNNFIQKTGQNGILVAPNETYRKTLTSQNIVIRQNTIREAGVVIKTGYGIRLDKTVGVEIRNNTISSLPRGGIFIIGNDNVVDKNVVRDTNRETEDSAAIVLLGRSWLYRGNTITNNFIADTGGYGLDSNGWVYKYFTWGVYLDDFMSGTVVTNNIISRSIRGAFQLHGGRDTRIINNVFAQNLGTANGYLQGIDAADGYYATMWQEMQNMESNGFDRTKYFDRYPELTTVRQSFSNSDAFANNTLTKNIYYFPDRPNTHQYWVRYFIGTEGSSTNQNLIWNGNQPIYVTHPESPGGQLTWEEWLVSGNDTTSLIADPLFVDPLTDNYQLPKTSPAFQIGFSPFMNSNWNPGDDNQSQDSRLFNDNEEDNEPDPPGSDTGQPETPPAEDSVPPSSPSDTTTGQTPSSGNKQSGNIASPTPDTLPTVVNSNVSPTTLPALIEAVGLERASVIIISLFVMVLMLATVIVMLVHWLGSYRLKRSLRAG